MQESDDIRLLAEYACHASEEAYAAIVARHLHLVHSVALRQTGNLHQTEEIAQVVFLILAKKAESLSSKTILTSWLYRTTRLTTANYLRMERRRQNREHEAHMQSLTKESESDTWTQIASMLDIALESLSQKDRDAVLLRFFQDKSIKDVSTTLCTSEGATQKRIERALIKLRVFFTKRGLALSAATLLSLLSAQGIKAAPTGLAESITTAGLAKGASTSGSTLLLMKSTMKIMTWLKIKTAIGVGVCASLMVGMATLTLAQIEQQRAQDSLPSTAIMGRLEDAASLPPVQFTASAHTEQSDIFRKANPSLAMFDHLSTVYTGILDNNKFRIQAVLNQSGGNATPAYMAAYDGIHYSYFQPPPQNMITTAGSPGITTPEMHLGTVLLLPYEFLFDPPVRIFGTTFISPKNISEKTEAPTQANTVQNSITSTSVAKQNGDEIEVRFNHSNGRYYLVTFSKNLRYLPVRFEKYNADGKLAMSYNVSVWKSLKGTGDKVWSLPQTAVLNSFDDGMPAFTTTISLDSIEILQSPDDNAFTIDPWMAAEIWDADRHVLITNHR